MKYCERFTAFFLLLLPGISLSAQTTTGNIGGIIRAATGEKLSGAVIRISYEPAGISYFTQSNRQGLYRFDHLQAGGPYTLEVSFIGFAAEKKQGIRLPLGEHMILDITMQPAITLLREIMVSARKKEHAPATGRLVIDKERLALLTGDGKNITDYLFHLPQARMIPGNEGAVSFAGQNNRYNAFFIDGAISNDVFGLAASGTNGGQAGISPLPVEAIEQLQVNLSPYDASIGNFTGAGINAITRSGSNRTESSLYHYLAAGNIHSYVKDLSASYHDNRYGLRMEGPLKRNRCFYFLNIELTRELRPKLFDPDTYTGQLTADQLSILAASLRSNYKYDAGSISNSPEWLYAARAVARTDWNLRPGSNLAVSLRYMEATRIFSNSSTATTIHFSNDAFSLQTRMLSASLEWRRQWKSDLSNRCILTYTGVRDDRGPSGKPFPRVRIYDGDASVLFGTDNSSTINLLVQGNWTFSDQLHWSSGKHLFGAGIDAEYNRVRNAFIQNSFGSYSYSSLGDFLSDGSPSSYQLGFSRIDSSQDDRIQGAAKFGMLRNAVFIQDEIRISPKWRISIGCRLDSYRFLTYPSVNAGLNDSVLPVISGFYELHRAVSGNPVSIAPAVSPRFSFQYSVSARTQLHGGLGIFSGRIPLAWPGGVYQLNGLITGSYSASGAGLNRIHFRADAYRQWLPAETGSVLNNIPVNLVIPDLRMPCLLRGSAMFDHDFSNGWKLIVEAMFSRDLASVSYTNINLAPPTDHASGADNRPVYTIINDGRIPISGGNPYDYIILLGNSNKALGWAYETGSSLRKLLFAGTVLEISYHYGLSRAITDGTSSVNSSQWRTVESVNGRNNLSLSNSDFSAGHKFSAWCSSSFKKGRKSISLSLSYTGQSGSSFSYVYQNSITRDDGKSGSYDLIYIPKSTELAAMEFLPNKVRNMLFTAAQQQEALEEYIRSTPYLAARRGSYAERNGSRTPFMHELNLKLAVGMGASISRKTYRFQFSIELLNLLNLINPNWGQRFILPADQLPLIEFAGFRSATDLTPQFRFDPGLLALSSWKNYESWSPVYASHWNCRLGLKFTW
ncbi:MAG: TonB-dependent receptor [Chitinophagaceae bacterium]|nr:TonB-dependent receptor [Chitinophagaceae bacterium]